MIRMIGVMILEKVMRFLIDPYFRNIDGKLVLKPQNFDKLKRKIIGILRPVYQRNQERNLLSILTMKKRKKKKAPD